MPNNGDTVKITTGPHAGREGTYIGSTFDTGDDYAIVLVHGRNSPLGREVYRKDTLTVVEA